jgi:hypothetical protein
VDDIIIDATLSHAMKLCGIGFQWICGKHGVGGIERALRFDNSDKTEKRYMRTMLKNWLLDERENSNKENPRHREPGCIYTIEY